MLTEETLPGDWVAVAGPLKVDVPVTLTLDTGPGVTVKPLWVSVVTVHTQLAPGPRPPCRTLSTDRRPPGQVTPASPHRPVLRPHLGTRTRLTVVRSGGPGVSVVTVSTDVTRVPSSVVGTVAHPGLHVTVVAVAVTVARNTPPRPLVIVTLLTGLTVLASVAHRTGALLHPLGGSSSRARESGVQPHSVNESLARTEEGASDLEGRQVGEERHELERRDLGPPALATVLVQDQLVALQSLAGQRIVLGRDVGGDSHLLTGHSPNQYHVFRRILNTEK